MHRRNSTGRKRGMVALTAVSLLLVPAAIAWACNPQAQLTPNKASFQPGEQMTLSGSFFPRTTQLAISGPGISQTVTTGSSGTFQVRVAVPSTPGNYTVRATRADGAAQSGLPKVASFQVARPAAAAPAPVTRAPAPTVQGGSPSFSEPGVVRSPSRGVARSTQPRGTQPRSQQQPTTGGVAGGGTVVTGATGVPVFAGSVAPAQTTFGAPAPAAAAKGTTARRGSSTAASGRASASDSDVWSGFAPGRTPSITSDTAGAPDDGSGSSLGLGIGLLALGLLALAAGLTAAEVQRRRSVR